MFVSEYCFLAAPSITHRQRSSDVKSNLNLCFLQFAEKLASYRFVDLVSVYM